MIELRQTRTLTTREERVLYDLWRRALYPEGGVRAYTAAYYFWYGAGGFLLLSIAMSLGGLNQIAPDRAAQLVVATLGFVAAHLFRAWQEQRVSRQYFTSQQQIGDHYVLDKDGLHFAFEDVRVVWSWSSIRSVHNYNKWLVALLPRNRALLLVKDAFEGQDLAAFCRALEARAI